jgi:hypothetical protein
LNQRKRSKIYARVGAKRKQLIEPGAIEAGHD